MVESYVQHKVKNITEATKDVKGGRLGGAADRFH
jgi:hypothetical protein